MSEKSTWNFLQSFHLSSGLNSYRASLSSLVEEWLFSALSWPQCWRCMNKANYPNPSKFLIMIHLIFPKRCSRTPRTCFQELSLLDPKRSTSSIRDVEEFLLSSGKALEVMDVALITSPITSLGVVKWGDVQSQSLSYTHKLWYEGLDNSSYVINHFFFATGCMFFCCFIYIYICYTIYKRDGDLYY